MWAHDNWNQNQADVCGRSPEVMLSNRSFVWISQSTKLLLLFLGCVSYAAEVHLTKPLFINSHHFSVGFRTAAKSTFSPAEWDPSVSAKFHTEAFVCNAGAAWKRQRLRSFLFKARATRVTFLKPAAERGGGQCLRQLGLLCSGLHGSD